jgi:hypothetical protein
MVDSIADASPRRLARTAGALYLINIAFGAFALGVVPALLIAGDMAATARNIQAHELLYRLGLAAHVVVTMTNIPMAVIFFELFKVVSRRLALLDMVAGLVATCAEISTLPGQFTPLILLGSAKYASALPAAQLHAAAYLPSDLSATGYSIYGVFYGLDFIVAAYLVYRSTFLPRAIGILLAIDALNYLAGGFAAMLAPGLAAHLGPWTGLPTIIAEGSLCLWLLVVGVDVRRWREQASAAIRMRATRLEELA